MNRRQFTKTIGATAALATVNPRLLWSAETSVSKDAAELYRRALVLDCNALAGIGFPISDDDPAGVTKLIVGSGVNVVKATLGGAQGNFEETVAAIAKAELLIEKQPESFCKIDNSPLTAAPKPRTNIHHKRLTIRGNQMRFARILNRNQTPSILYRIVSGLSSDAVSELDFRRKLATIQLFL